MPRKEFLLPTWFEGNSWDSNCSNRSKVSPRRICSWNCRGLFVQSLGTRAKKLRHLFSIVPKVDFLGLQEVHPDTVSVLHEMHKLRNEFYIGWCSLDSDKVYDIDTEDFEMHCPSVIASVTN